MPMKPCKECGVVKPLGDFHRHPQMKDGHLNICKLCKKQYDKDRVAALDTLRVLITELTATTEPEQEQQHYD